MSEFYQFLVTQCTTAYAQYLVFLPDGPSDDLDMALAIHDAYFQMILKYNEKEKPQDANFLMRF